MRTYSLTSRAFDDGILYDFGPMLYKFWWVKESVKSIRSQAEALRNQRAKGITKVLDLV